MKHGTKQGILITFEGTEGAGKSTLIGLVARELKTCLARERRSRAVTITREPGGSQLAEKIRGLLLEEEMDPRCELFLYEAARAEHLTRTLDPALRRGDFVLCDRFTDSSLAYQAHARGLPWKEVEALNQIATRGLKPRLTILVDVDPAVGLARARDGNRFEAEGLEFQQKVRRGFLKSMRQDPDRWFWLKARPAHTPEQNAWRVAEEIWNRFGKRSRV